MMDGVTRDFTLDPASFQAIAKLAYRESGLTLVKEKSSMIQSRLRHRLRALGLQDFAAYCALVQSDAGADERQHLISALTTNVSHFFRENHHFDILADIFRARLPQIRKGAPFRVWSAGCSNGQEAVSAAITLLQVAGDAHALDVRILGTDIDRKVVRFARAGCYDARQMSAVPDALAQLYFRPAGTADAGQLSETSSQIKAMLTFNELNLLATWPMRRSFDVIFCRNVVIYFDLPTQQKIWPGFKKALAPEGMLFLGHSERIADPGAFGFEGAGPTAYQHKSA